MGRKLNGLQSLSRRFGERIEKFCSYGELIYSVKFTRRSCSHCRVDIVKGDSMQLRRRSYLWGRYIECVPTFLEKTRATTALRIYLCILQLYRRSWLAIWNPSQVPATHVHRMRRAEEMPRPTIKTDVGCYTNRADWTDHQTCKFSWAHRFRFHRQM